MSQWWTYRPSDFLMFSPRTYWRLIELYQRDVWPMQLLALGAGAALLWLAMRRPPAASRVICAVLALAWLWVAWAFHWQRYATINWGARYFAIAFAVQATGLLALGVLGARRRPAAQRDRLRGFGLLLAALGVLAYPFAGVLAGRPWAQAEVFGMTPDPTALTTIGLLLAAGPARSGWLNVIPAISLAVGIATLWLITG